MGALSSFVVVVPAYNEESTIIDALDSIVAASKETSVKLEQIIVCVNGCTDATESLVQAWKGGPLTVIRSKRGMVPAMNRLISYARKFYGKAALIKTDGDTTVSPKAFYYLFEQLRLHPELMVAGGHPMPITTGLSPLRRITARVTSIRSHYPLAEVAVKDAAIYLPMSP